MLLALVALLVATLLAPEALSVELGTITTVAGTSAAGYSGDSGPANQASLNSPIGIAVDSQGNLFIVDLGNNRIRKVDNSGAITTVAGTGTAGYSGDGGPATQANLYLPAGVAVDNQGNLFIADYGNRRVRKVDSSGIITTVAGTGTSGFSGDGGPATQASLYHPYGVAVDGQGNLFIADYGNHRVRKVDSSGIITTVVGTGTLGYGGDGGPAISALLNYPSGVAVDGHGTLFIADLFNHRVRRVGADGIITTVVGTGTSGFSGDGGPATQASLYNPYGVAVDGQGNLFIADQLNQRVRKVDSNGIITTVVGTGAAGFSGDGGPATLANLYRPNGVAVDGQGNLFIADTGNSRIRKVVLAAPTPTPTPQGGTWSTKTPLPAARSGAAVGVISGVLYVAGGHDGVTGGTSTLQAYNATTNAWSTLAPMTQVRYSGDGAGVINSKLYVAGGWNYPVGYVPTSTLFVYDPATNSWSTKVSMPTLSADGASGVINGKLYVTTAADGYSGYRKFLHVYDPVANTWTSLPNSPNAHAAPAYGVINDKFYVAGGGDENGSPHAQLDVYDPATNTWTTKAPVPAARLAPASAVINGMLYVAGGTTGAGAVYNTVYVYDPATDTWTTETSMPTARSSAAAGAINGTLYVAGGSNSTGTLATVEAFAATSINYVITASAGSGGSITPTGAVTVSDGGSQTFTITPSTGYRVLDVLVDGVSVGAVASYPFTNVVADHTIAASFSLAPTPTPVPPTPTPVPPTPTPVPHYIRNLPLGLEMVTQDLATNLSQVAQAVDTPALLRDAQGRVVARLQILYSQLSADLDFASNLTALSEPASGKAVLHRLGGYPTGVGTRDLYVPKLPGHDQVRVFPNATTLGEVGAVGQPYSVLKPGEAGLSHTIVDGQEYWVVENVSGTGAQGETAPAPTPTPTPATPTPTLVPSTATATPTPPTPTPSPLTTPVATPRAGGGARLPDPPLWVVMVSGLVLLVILGLLARLRRAP